MAVTDPPISNGALRRITLNLRKTVPTHGLGAHLRRHAGQSLVFREYRDYQMGDDIRLVDWAASRRSGQAGQKIVKSFESEEQMTLVLVIDDRAAMRLPKRREKLLLALWIARALAVIAAENGDRVVLASLFSTKPPARATGRQVPAVARSFCEKLWQDGSNDLEQLPVSRALSLTKLLTPASAVVLISDLLFDDPDGSVARFAQEAQKSWRDFHVVGLNSIDAELAGVRQFERMLVENTEGRLFPEESYAVDDPFVAEIRQRVHTHIEALRNAWSGRGLVWHRPLVLPTISGNQALAQMFIKCIGHLPVAQSIAARGLAK